MSVPATELVLLCHSDKAPGYAVRRNSGSPSWLLMWTEAGSGHVEQGGWSGTAGPGDLVVLGSRVAQHYRVAPGADGWRFWWIHFQPRPMWLTWLTPFTRGTRCYVMRELAPAVRARVGAVFLRAHADARWSGHGAPPQPDPLAAAHPAIAEAPVARELVLGAVEEVLVLASAAAPAAEESADPRVRQAQAFIAAEPGAPHTVETLAKAVALSPSRFAHLFAAQTGRTPMRAVREARLRYAAQLLEVTDLDIGQVAAAAGFVSPFHFSRTFSRHYGLAPREFRARLPQP
ncbi:helix-turn-helix domain-containing protein [Nonomuraea sp. NBC_01738]|uniref:helix-turn-helix domain-containing protein n=1 Tax=Nonomuraea sp. NBC_01738 TaxID=2976003 RepID=UPI002E0FDC18|nr:helix-turn-helix domain-containing protein [Nonomuraea sp. NBC_01738]